MGGGGQTPHCIFMAEGQLRIASDALRLGLLPVNQSVGRPDGAFIEPRQIVGRVNRSASSCVRAGWSRSIKVRRTTLQPRSRRRRASAMASAVGISLVPFSVAISASS